MLDINIPDPSTSPSVVSLNGFCGRKAPCFLCASCWPIGLQETRKMTQENTGNDELEDRKRPESDRDLLVTPSGPQPDFVRLRRASLHDQYRNITVGLMHSKSTAVSTFQSTTALLKRCFPCYILPLLTFEWFNEKKNPLKFHGIVWNRVDCQRSEKRSKTQRERFTIGQTGQNVQIFEEVGCYK